MKIVAISDTHTDHWRHKLPHGDVLVHAGDFSDRRDRDGVLAFLRWFSEQPHEHKLFIAGNHDGLFETQPQWARSVIPDNVDYLQDSGVCIDGVKFWGSPWQPFFNNWHFNLPRGSALAKKWALIPHDIDVLITHGPPHGMLDMAKEFPRPIGRKPEMVHTGCEELAKAVGIVKPKVHIFGHIHEGAGVYETPSRTYINASSMNGNYAFVHPPRVIEI